MSEIIFCATDYYLQGGYVPYQDFFRLAELSGYPVIPLSQLEPDSDNSYIVTPINGEWLLGWNKPKARIIHYMLEWNNGTIATIPPGISETWCGDKWHAEKYGYKYVPLGSHPGLNIVESSNIKQYDVAFMGYRGPHRRATQINAWQDANITIAQDAWGLERSQNMTSSWLMVIVHQWDNLPVIAPLRMCLAAAHKLAILTETVNDPGIFGNFIRQSKYEHMTAAIRFMLGHTDTLHREGEELYNLLCKHYTFRDSIERGLAT